MESTARKFTDVFEKIPLSKGLVKNLEKAYIDSIKVNKKERKMDISLNFYEVTNESVLPQLEAEIQKQFPFISNVSLNVNYLFPEIDTNSYKIIGMFWENVLNKINTRSPFCYGILKDSAWEFHGNILTVKVYHNCSFIFTKKRIDKEIETFLNSRLKTNVKVTFVDELPSQNKNEKYISEIAQRQDAIVIQMLEQNTDENKAPSGEPSKSSSTDKSSYFNNSGTFKKRGRSSIKINNEIKGDIKSLNLELEENEPIVVEGQIFELESRETKSGNLLVSFDMSDGKNSVTIKFFINPEKYTDEFKSLIKKGNTVIVAGKVQFDTFAKEINIMATEIGQGSIAVKRTDNAEEKRVELHLHTQMSSMDGITPVKEYIKRAVAWGHKAIAITDHGVVQAFPEAMECKRGTDLKIIYGVEAYIVDDLGAIVQCAGNQTLDDNFVIFDLETTGLNKDCDKITEIGAVKVSNGVIVDTFSTLINPQTKLSEKIIKLTNITDDMLKDAPLIEEMLPKFLDFVSDSVLVAHNAAFDMSFIWQNAKNLGFEVANTVLDTLELSRTLFPELSKHKLNIVAEHLGISLENHHRAVDDATATAEIFIKCTELLRQKGIQDIRGINLLGSSSIDKSKLKAYHAIILVKNYVGLRNLYELISNAHIKYFFKRPRIPKSEYIKFKEGLIIGTACDAGEFYKAVANNKPDNFIRELAEFYDYFEIQPTGNNMYLLREGKVGSVNDLKNTNRKIVELGERYKKPVVATCDVHFIDPEDSVYRKIIMAGEGFKDADNQAPLFFRTTEEMLEEFSYLGIEKAKEVVITNTNLIADLIEDIKPIPDETFPPKIEGAEEEIKEITMKRAKELYGEDLPQLVRERLDKELTSIIKNGFSVMYIIAQKLVWKSLEDGYLVGSRGSVGSSFVATMSGITEVNPLPAHYLCPNCKYSDFDSEVIKQFAGGSGCDMPDRVCPVCQSRLGKDGHDIPFETFLGFDGDKEPDIDLNFSGEYQANAHAYTEELFGSEHVFKAGTIGTLADKTAYGYVKKYMDERNITSRSAEINRLKIGCTGIKRTTGQHPGGLMVVPSDHSIYEFCPIQRPANDTKSTVTTTHFDYHSISGRLLKLDILGHDVPTIIRMLHDITGVDPRTVSLGDKQTISLFTSPEALGVTSEEINCKTGTLGLPEFGTSFVRQMLLDTKPASFGELVRISGLSHGTDVWFNNAQELIKDNIATLKEVIPTRDDIMVFLINQGVEKKAAFKIMENVRKGKGLTEAEVKTMQAVNIPDWYIESCRRIKYMFPKGHAVAYVMMTVRIGYFKINYPYSFYAASFSVKAEDFDYELMCHGKEKVFNEINRIAALGKEATTKEKGLLTILELVYEMYARGLKFVPLDLYKADANKFLVFNDGLMPPLCAVQGLGISVAQNLVESRKDGEFITIEDFRNRTKINKTVIELLKRVGVLGGMPDTSQLSLF